MYNEYSSKHLPVWYQNLSLHDSYIVDVNKDDINNTLTVNVKYDDNKQTKYQIIFYNYEIIENCNLNSSTIIADELYINFNNVEFHLMVDTYAKNDVTLEYFTISCEKLEFRFLPKFIAKARNFPTENLIISKKGKAFT